MGMWTKDIRMCKQFIYLLQVFLTKHFKNQRLWDPEFVLDFEKIYVIDSKTKSITRAKVLVRLFFLGFCTVSVISEVLNFKSN